MSDDNTLRLEIATVLTPGPHKHLFVVGYDAGAESTCVHCGLEADDTNRDSQCPTIRVSVQPMEVLVRQLIVQFMPTDRIILLSCTIAETMKVCGYEPINPWRWFAIVATPAEQAECMLAAIKETKKVEVK